MIAIGINVGPPASAQPTGSFRANRDRRRSLRHGRRNRGPGTSPRQNEANQAGHDAAAPHRPGAAGEVGGRIMIAIGINVGPPTSAQPTGDPVRCGRMLGLSAQPTNGPVRCGGMLGLSAQPTTSAECSNRSVGWADAGGPTITMPITMPIIIADTIPFPGSSG